MKFRTMTTTAVLMLVACFATLALSTGAASVSAASKKHRELLLTKDCTGYTGAAGSSCTITASSLWEIPVGSKVFYDQPAGIPTNMLDSNVILDAGDENRAVGRCTLDLVARRGLCTFSDGTGRLAGFHARLDVSPLVGRTWALDGTYRFRHESDRHGREAR
jgi:hypothetical protein